MGHDYLHLQLREVGRWQGKRPRHMDMDGKRQEVDVKPGSAFCRASGAFRAGPVQWFSAPATHPESSGEFKTKTPLVSPQTSFSESLGMGPRPTVF